MPHTKHGQMLASRGAYAPDGRGTGTVESVAPASQVRVGLTVGRLRDLIRNLPDSMDVRIVASIDNEECHVKIAETYKDSRGGTLMLSDVPTPGTNATVIFDKFEQWERP